MQADKHGPGILARLQQLGGGPQLLGGEPQLLGGGSQLQTSTRGKSLELPHVAAAAKVGAGSGTGVLLQQSSATLPIAVTQVSQNIQTQEAIRNVSVIQRTPNPERPEPPKILLERRVMEIPEHIKQELLAGIKPVPVKLEQEPQAKEKLGVHSKRSPPQGQRTNQQQSDHLVCQVCGERAGKHSYYGGQVCPSCRAFFRRSVQSGYHTSFRCSQGRGRCEISLTTRKNCQYCRSGYLLS